MTGATTCSLNGCEPVRLFQSAPRSRDRGDESRRDYRVPASAFQSAPRSRDRGDLLLVMIVHFPTRFNPRPGHVTGATFSILAWSSPSPCFNPRPGHVTGATLENLRQYSIPACFNPRPGHVTGATYSPGYGLYFNQVSIRAPVT